MKKTDKNQDTGAFEASIEKFSKEADKAGIPGKGHNKKAPRPGGIAVDQLKSIIARVEKLEEEKAAIGMDISDVFTEAKGNGFDIKTIRKIIRMRKQDASQREEEETILDTYLHALGMIPQYEFDLEADPIMKDGGMAG